MTPVFVLMTADTVGGVWTYALDLARGLGSHGVRVLLATLGPAPDERQREAARAIPRLLLVETALPLDWLAADAGEVAAAGAALAELARLHDVDLVHLNSPALAAGGAFDRPVLATCHSCVRTWWDAVRGGSLPPDLAWRAEQMAAGCRAADALAAPTRAFAEATAASYRLATVPVVVPNGRDRVAAEALPDAPPVFTAGRLWDDGKNVATLDRVAARLAVPFVAAGPLRGPNGAATTPRHLRTPGSLDGGGVARHLAASPVFVSLARYEPFGLAVLEAAGAGCPLVLSDTATFRELWDGAATFVPAHDDVAAAAAVQAFLDDPALHRAAGERARTRAGRFTVDAMADATLALYRDIIARPRRHAA